MSKTTGRPFKKGQSGNPAGSSAISRELGNIRKLNHIEIASLITKFADMPLSELIAFAQNKENKSLHIGVASIYINMIKSGDPSRATLLFDRTAGRVKEQIEHQIVGSVQTQILDTILEIEKANKLEVTNGKTRNEMHEQKSTQEIGEKTTQEKIDD